MSFDSDKPIIIIGAGLVGLTAAQALTRAGFRVEIYDRESGPSERPAGWAITIHWALTALQIALKPELYDKVPSCQVDPAIDLEGGHIPYPNTNAVGHRTNSRLGHPPVALVNLETGVDILTMPPRHGYRLNRKSIRDLLSTDINIRWNSQFREFEETENGIVAVFADGNRVEGSLLIGADGKNSKVKRQLLGSEEAQISVLPIGFIGLTLRLSKEQIEPIRKVHPIVCHGPHSNSGFYAFWSLMSTPESNGSAGTVDAHYECQLNVSWMIERHGQAPESHEEQIAFVKKAATIGCGWFPALKRVVLEMPNDTPALALRLEDQFPKAWDTRNGKVALLGDAAHAMTMYRGEACNHGMYDVMSFLHQLMECRSGTKTQVEAIRDYQEEMLERSRPAVLLSRSATYESHDHERLGLGSRFVLRAGYNAAERFAKTAQELTSVHRPHL